MTLALYTDEHIHSSIVIGLRLRGEDLINQVQFLPL
jgi:hypothetical protein